MAMRHGVFDGAFFLTRSQLQQYGVSSTGILFGASALVASAANIIFDIWKTQAFYYLPDKVCIFLCPLMNYM